MSDVVTSPDANGGDGSAPTPSASCRDANGVRIPPAPTVVVRDEPGQPLRLSLADGMGGVALFDLRPDHALAIAEDLVAAARRRMVAGEGRS